MSLVGYDAWKLATPPEYETSGAIESAISNEPELNALQRRIEIADGRAQALAHAEANATGARRVRIARLLAWAKANARNARRALEDALDDFGDEP